ncbi:MAG: ABC transporter ATP-binding protein [Candidatus Roseilinea sp.]|jgi:putative ABC transport system ATP-binding protein|uniref:ABC transporter ATP-binding protein n=1 Tax=Candidatus Roseilinea sp. NK_OTU-006 TaxID=2704250 RepID=UPI00145F4CAE|nr:ABC transporter ATP-binding protein [Candidatus Roseilinea sp. NK_OTU-006]BCX04957.1 MAG: ABC transporter ATP-binding protein [Candidatus Roseilinea sp.]
MDGTSAEPVVRAENVERVYGSGENKVYALRGVSFEAPSGAFIALKGRSGSGKTTLINCIGGLDKPTRGKVYLFGQPINDYDEAQMTELRRHKIGFVFQSFSLVPTFTAFENVDLSLRLAGAPAKERARRAQECLDLVGIGKWAKHMPFELSGGQQQRVAIARALANSPKLILADEPTGELDSHTARQVLGLLRDLSHQQNVTVIMATHDPLSLEYADQVFELKDGRLDAVHVRQ